MMRLLTAFAVAGSMLTLLPAPIAPIARRPATPPPPCSRWTGPTSWRRTLFLNCFKGDGHCDFVVGADMRTPDGVTGFPPGLWARQTTEVRSSNRLAYLDVHGTGQFERVNEIDGVRRGHHRLLR